MLMTPEQKSLLAELEDEANHLTGKAERHERRKQFLEAAQFYKEALYRVRNAASLPLNKKQTKDYERRVARVIELHNQMIYKARERRDARHMVLGVVMREPGVLQTELYRRMPQQPPEVLVATAGPLNARRAGRLADGLITVGAPLEKISGLFERFDDGAREVGKDPSTMPKVLQLHLSWAETDEEALRNALVEWPNGGMRFPKADIRSPHDFAAMAKMVREEDFEGRMVISSDPDVHRAAVQAHVDLGFDRVYLHNVGRNQREWLEVFGREVLPKLHR